MSKIRFEKGNGNVIYKSKLQEAITNVLNKIGITDSEIEWIIFHEEDYLQEVIFGKTVLNPSFIYDSQYVYGFCYIDKKEIFISTAAIKTYNIWNLIEKKPRVYGMQEEREILLVDVLLDELAHIKTGRNHGDQKYEATLEKYRKAYYKSPAWRF